MRNLRSLFAAVALASAAVLATPSPARAAVAVSISVFHDDLAPYGSWVAAGPYGSCFVPRVAVGWAPYVDGEWVYTDYGWTWVSNDPFGDVPFHYGAWTWFDPYGWIWVPGTVWAPAWVTWAYGDDYVGWAPVPPSFGFTSTGYVGSPVVLPATRYVFVPTRQFVGVPVSSVRLPAERNSVIFARTVKTTDYRVAGGVVRTSGPPPARVERVAGHTIAPVSIDRVKARPTTLAEAGVAKASRIRVAAPASETRRLAAEKPAAESRAAAKPAKSEAHREAPKSATAGHVRETAPPPNKKKETAHEPARSAKNEPARKSAPAASAEHGKPKPETHTASSQGHASAAAEKPKKAPEAVSREKAPAHEPPSTAHGRPAEPPRAEPREETHVAARNGPPPNAPAHRAAPAKPRPKPPEKKPEGEHKPE